LTCGHIANNPSKSVAWSGKARTGPSEVETPLNNLSVHHYVEINIEHARELVIESDTEPKPALVSSTIGSKARSTKDPNKKSR